MNLPAMRNAQGIVQDKQNLTGRKGAHIWDRMAKRYAGKPVPSKKNYNHKLDVTRHYLASDLDVLELGCGTGATAIAHAPFVRHIRASDYSPNMISIARSRAVSEQVSNVDFVCQTVHQELSAGNRYDVVLMLSILHLLPNWEATIDAVHRVLHTGGVLVVNSPCLKDIAAWLAWIAPVGSKLGIMPQLSFFSAAELKVALSVRGFELEYSWQADTKSAVFLVLSKLQHG